MMIRMPKYIRTEKGIYEVVEDNNKEWGKQIVVKFPKNLNMKLADVKDQIINSSDNLAELCDEFVFNSDVSNYVIDKNYVEHAKATILKIYKENSDIDYVKAMHPKFYGAIWTDKGLIYVAKMNDEGKLVLI
jgi:hypothetical protein